MVRPVNVALLFLLVANIQSFILPYDEVEICKNGKSQSPVSVDLSQTIYVPYPSFSFSNGYHQSMKFQVLNEKNHTISITPIVVAPRTLVVSGGCLSGIFTFQSAHLHWPQSEHTFVESNYVAEAHFIHKNLDTNHTAVFAYFFTITNSQSQENEYAMNNWERVVQGIDNANLTLEGGLASLMEGKKNRFIHYTGSLTTPPCTEGISWILVSSAIKLHHSSLNRLQRTVITSNYRVTQPLNGRLIRRSFPSTLWNIA